MDDFDELLGKFSEVMNGETPLMPSYGQSYGQTYEDETDCDDFTDFDEINDCKDFVGFKNFNSSTPIKQDYCYDCDKPMIKEPIADGNTIWMCPDCAKQGNYIYESVSIGTQELGYNSTDALFINSGNPGRSSVISLSGSSYQKLKERNTKQQLENIISQAGSIGISKAIIKKAISSMLAIQSDNIYRGDVRKGTMAACLYRVCKSHESPLKSSQIAKLFNIESKTLSEGNKKICRLISKGVITESIFACDTAQPQSQNEQVPGFIKKYFEILSVPDVYILEGLEGSEGSKVLEVSDPQNRIYIKKFVVAFVKFMQHFRICSSSNDSSRCAGITQIIALCVPELGITASRIEKECEISKTTFIKIVNVIRELLITNEPGKQKTKYKLRHLFKKYGLPYDF